MTQKTNEIIEKVEPVETQDDKSVDTFISKAIENNLPVEVMEKLFALREKVKAEKAKEEFVKALAKFQSLCQIIEKTKVVYNKDGRTVRYKYAPIDAIVEQIKKPLSEAKLSYTWEVKNEDKFITAVAVITHILGHSERSEFKIPVGMSEYMTAPQNYASALTFAKRYSLCNALGISTGEEDNDATTATKETDAKSIKAKIVFLLRSLGEKHQTKDQISEAVTRRTRLDLDEKNYSEIIARLQILVNEKNADSQIR